VVDLKPSVTDAGGLSFPLLAPSRMAEIWRVKGGLTALRVGIGEFALIPQEKMTSSKCIRKLIKSFNLKVA
jgi:hypothetical protein